MKYCKILLIAVVALCCYQCDSIVDVEGIDAEENYITVPIPNGLRYYEGEYVLDKFHVGLDNTFQIIADSVIIGKDKNIYLNVFIEENNDWVALENDADFSLIRGKLNAYIRIYGPYKGKKCRIQLAWEE